MKVETIVNGFYAALFAVALVAVGKGMLFAVTPLVAQIPSIAAGGSLAMLF